MLGLGLDQLWRITPQEYLALEREQRHLHEAQSGGIAPGNSAAPRKAGILPPDVEREEQDMMAQARAMFYGGDVPCG